MLAARLVEIYKADAPDALTVILSADGFGDLLERAEFLDRISDQDREITDRVRGLRDQAQGPGGAARRPRGARSSSPPSASSASATRSRPSRSSSWARATSSPPPAPTSAARSPRCATAACALEGDLRRARARAGARAGGAPGRLAGPIKQGSGQLDLAGERAGRVAVRDALGPAPRRHRHRGAGRHARSTPPTAGASILMGWVGGYGNYTCIQHTGSLSTCYAHQSSFATSNGASVSQGQVIGYVGCTGHCFGDHLHFETRINGSPVDPMGYL